MKIKKKDRGLLFAAIGVILFAIIANIVLEKVNDSTIDYESLTEEELEIAIDKKVEDMAISKLQDMDEYERMKYYIGEFTSCIETKDYEKAYSYLYDDFKENYFPTLESFESYVKEQFPAIISIEHENIERNGDIYVLWLKMANALGSKNTAVEMNFVIRENKLNDIDMSFTVFK